jgi:ADP-heptose:LPS heptosyltransferase
MSQPHSLYTKTRYLAWLGASICLVMAGSVHAQEQEIAPEMKRIQSMLAVFNGELKSDLDQILLLQEALKANARGSLEAQGRSPDALMVDDVAAAQRRAIQREAALNTRLDAILARSAVLDARKQPLLERLRELATLPSVPLARLDEAAKQSQ